MSEILLVKQHPAEIPEAERAAARKVIFGAIDGLGEDAKKSWRRFWNMAFRLQPGEVIDLKLHKERIGLNHRKHMLMEQRVFEGQERFDNFEHFRNWLKIGAGFCSWYPGPKGGVIAVPKSIAYNKIDELEMQKVHDDMVAFLRTPHAAKTLWPKLPVAQRAFAIEEILEPLRQ